jgi:NAD(P)H-dependent flavin oxidoreductase YrpB (nitropropane dioxygenase family)
VAEDATADPAADCAAAYRMDDGSSAAAAAAAAAAECHWSKAVAAFAAVATVAAGVPKQRPSLFRHHKPHPTPAPPAGCPVEFATGSAGVVDKHLSGSCPVGTASPQVAAVRYSQTLCVCVCITSIHTDRQTDRHADVFVCVCKPSGGHRPTPRLPNPVVLCVCVCVFVCTQTRIQTR